jgi:hypothetical protein
MLVLDGKPLFPTEASVYSTWVRGDHRSIVVRFDDGRRARIGFDQVTSVIATKRRKKAA